MCLMLSSSRSSFIQALVNLLPPLSLCSTLGVFSLRKGPRTSRTCSAFFWVIGEQYLAICSKVMAVKFLSANLGMVPSY